MPDTVSSASTLERPALLRQVEIPPTDPEHYITGLYALNVQAPESTRGLAQCLPLARGLRQSASGHFGRQHGN